MAEINRFAVPDRLFSEVPEADAAEQWRMAVDDSASAMERLRLPFEVDHADAMDQSRVVPAGDDY
ncbi:hypothetical protein ACNTMW_14900 [Planosporangium sp. 12N6]|uniref:hypothetical protein n=1 Tax=Planosporangium spinosum TaxID=3402278 RepID=UPI003CF77147